MHVPTEKILGFSLMQVSEVASSNCMKKGGLKRCLQNLERAGNRQAHPGCHYDEKRQAT